MYPNVDPKIEIKHPEGADGDEPFLPYLRDENLGRPWAIPGAEGLMHRVGGLEKEHETFKFYHGFGLGVLRKPGGDNIDSQSQLLDLLFSSDEAQQNVMRDFYVHAGEYLEAKRKVKRLTKQVEK